MWLECIGVVSGCCKEVYRFPHNITLTCVSFFLKSCIPTSLFILKMFFVLVYVIFVQYSKRCSKNI